MHLQKLVDLVQLILQENVFLFRQSDILENTELLPVTPILGVGAVPDEPPPPTVIG